MDFSPFHYLPGNVKLAQLKSLCPSSSCCFPLFFLVSVLLSDDKVFVVVDSVTVNNEGRRGGSGGKKKKERDDDPRSHRYLFIYFAVPKDITVLYGEKRRSIMEERISYLSTQVFE